MRGWRWILLVVSLSFAVLSVQALQKEVSPSEPEIHPASLDRHKPFFPLDARDYATIVLSMLGLIVAAGGKAVSITIVISPRPDGYSKVRTVSMCFLRDFGQVESEVEASLSPSSSFSPASTPSTLSRYPISLFWWVITCTEEDALSA